MQIITNNHPRDLLQWEELTPREQREFDWMNEALQQEAQFWRYKGSVYTDQDFMRTDMRPWDGILADSAFSAILVRFINNGERVICGRAYS